MVTRLTGTGVALLSGVLVMMSAPPAPAESAKVGFGEYAPSESYDEQHVSSFYLPMRDGIRLAVTLYRPAAGGEAAEGRFPAIFHHTIDRRTRDESVGGPGSSFASIPTLTRFGYVVAVVERRGNGASFGARRGYHDRNEAHDAYEIVQWLADQPWSTGSVGVYGCSNTGEAALHAATVMPPALKAVFSGCFSWHKYDGMLRGGIFAQWGTGPERTFEQAMQAQPVDGDEGRELLREAVTQQQQSTNLRELWASLPYRDSFSPVVQSAFWGEGAVASYQDQFLRSGVALYAVAGWQDELRAQNFIAFANMPEGRGRIVAGDWQHCRNPDFDLLAEAHRFFDEHLKGVDTGLSDQDPVQFYTVNAGWRSSPVWPLPDARDQVYHLSGGRLAVEEQGEPGRFQVRYDVECAPDPVQPSPFSQPCPPEHGLQFESEVLDRGTELTGHPVMDLWITADQPDVNLFAYLEDVAEDGSSRVVTEGRLRAMVRKTSEAPYEHLGLPYHRAFEEDAQPLVPGEPARMHFDLQPVSWYFPAGHRLRITLAGADYRERDRTPRDPAATITVLQRSTISLPVLP